MNTGNRKQGWMGRRSLAFKVVLGMLLVTVMVMSIIAGYVAWQSEQRARQTVEREMRTALVAVDNTLQLVFRSATERSREIMPVLLRYLGGEPQLDGSSVFTEGGMVPGLVAEGLSVTGYVRPLELVQETTGAQSEVIVRSGNTWLRAATLLENSDGQKLNGSKLDANSLVAQALDRGENYAGLLQQRGRWFAIVVEALRDNDGTVFGGLTVTIDVDSEVQRVLNWITTMRKIADIAPLMILQRNPAGAYTFVAGGGTMMDMPFGSIYRGSDETRLTALIERPAGFEQLVLDVEQGDAFVMWSAIENWEWVALAVGNRAGFLAESRADLKNQLVIMLLGTLLIVGLAGLVARTSLRPVRDVVQAMEEVGQGNLALAIPEPPPNTPNEVRALFGALIQIQGNLRNTVSAVRQSVEEIRVGTHEIAAGNTNLSSRTEQQAASLQETASSMEQLASTVQQNADNSRQASQSADNASSIAQQGGEAIHQVVGTMDDIAASSQKIVDIVSVIEGIAFQTNILALNAAVEAERAGEEGKGFAVVASEVRSLALRSADAAKEIKDLIDDSSHRVVAGTQEVRRAGTTMDEIVWAVQDVTRLMREIATASVEQSSGIGQVHQAIGQMDEVTQQNAALVEEAASAAASLQEQVEQLTQAVAVFRLDKNHDLALALIEED